MDTSKLLEGAATTGANAMTGGLAGAGASLLTGLVGGDQDKKQLEQQQKLTDMSVAAQKQLYDYTFNQDTYGRDVKNMKAAGLNPALLYGLGGSSGQTGTTGSAGTGTASGAADREMAKSQQAAVGLEQAKIQSEIGVNEAMAEKYNAEAEKTAGVDTEKATAEIGEIGATIDKIMEEVKNFQVGRRLMEIESNLKGAQTEKAMQEITNLRTQNKIDEGQAKSLIEITVQQAVNEKIKGIVMKKGIEMTDAQMKNMANQIAVEWGKIGVGIEGNKISQDKVDVDQIFNNFKMKHPNVLEHTGGMLEELKNGMRDWIKK